MGEEVKYEIRNESSPKFVELQTYLEKINTVCDLLEKIYEKVDSILERLEND